jgi:hypothetical protein
MRYAGPCASYSLYILAILLQVPDGLMAAYESQSEEEEMDEICGTLVQSRHCLQAIQAETRLNIQQHRAVGLCRLTDHTCSSCHCTGTFIKVVDHDPDPSFYFLIIFFRFGN